MNKSTIDKYRDRTRKKAGDAGGELIFELRHHDIFQFKNEENIDTFSKWIKSHDEVELIESGHNFRLGVKYKKGKHD